MKHLKLKTWLAGFAGMVFCLGLQAQPLTLRDPGMVFLQKEASVAGGGGGLGCTACATLQSNLLAYYSFNTLTNLGMDSSGNGYNLSTNLGGTYSYTNGVIGTGGLSISGSYLYLPDNVNFRINGANSFCIVGWFYVSSASVFEVEKLTDNYFFTPNGGNQMEFSVNNTAGTSFTAITANTIPLNTWFFVAAWYDKTLGQIGVQVNNGTAVTSSITGTPGDPTGNNGNFVLGAYTGNLISAVDELGVWKRALTGGEISELYNNGAGRTFPFTQ